MYCYNLYAFIIVVTLKKATLVVRHEPRKFDKKLSGFMLEVVTPLVKLA